jgi:hypothetical protein
MKMPTAMRDQQVLMLIVGTGFSDSNTSVICSVSSEQQ